MIMLESGSCVRCENEQVVQGKRNELVYTG